MTRRSRVSTARLAVASLPVEPAPPPPLSLPMNLLTLAAWCHVNEPDHLSHRRLDASCYQPTRFMITARCEDGRQASIIWRGTEEALVQILLSIPLHVPKDLREPEKRRSPDGPADCGRLAPMNDKLTDEALAELERIDRAMSSAPWHTGESAHYKREARDSHNAGVAWCGTFPEADAYANAAGLVALRNSVGPLVAEVRRLRAVEAARLGLERARLERHRVIQTTGLLGGSPFLASKLADAERSIVEHTEKLRALGEGAEP
jgi:hypothetical protein